MKVLSLFDGISCGRVALERAGLHVDTYVAYEINKFATNVSQSNYPDIVRCGNVVGADFTQYEGFDLVMGGFPCTDLSIAKTNRKGLKGEHSILFWELVRAIKEVEPRYFLVENNASMPAADKAIITNTLGVEPIMINSALVSAQNRKRLYWTNIPGIVQPKDKGILLKDILDGAMAINHSNGKARTIIAGYGDQSEGNLLGIVGYGSTGVAEPIEFPYRKNTDIIVTEKGLRCQRRDKKKSTAAETKVTFINGKSDTLISAHIPKIMEPVRVGHYGKGARAQRIYSVIGKSITLMSTDGGGGSATGLYKINLPDGYYIIRKLTPIECERLQTLPDNYTKAVSNTQRYKCLGNGWTIDVIVQLLIGIELKRIIKLKS